LSTKLHADRREGQHCVESSLRHNVVFPCYASQARAERGRVGEGEGRRGRRKEKRAKKRRGGRRATTQ